MLKVAVRPLPNIQRVWSLLLLSAAACGRFGFDVEALDRDGSAEIPTRDSGVSLPADAGGRDGSSPSGSDDAGDVRDGGDAPADACANVTGAVVCEAFEDDELGNNVETKVSDGKLRIKNGALIASIERGGGKAALRWSFDKLKQGSFFLRVSLTVPAGVGIEALSVSSLASDEKDTDIAFTLLDQDRLQVSIQEDSKTLAGAYECTRDVPMCLRARIDIDETAGDVVAGIDAAQDVDTGNVDTLPGKGISELKVGIGASADKQDAIELRINDVILSASDPGPCQ